MVRNIVYVEEILSDIKFLWILSKYIEVIN